MLINWIKGFDKLPKTVFVNHGNDEVCDEFALTVTKQTGITCVAPYTGAEYDLITGICLESGNKRKIVKSVQAERFRESSAFHRLYNASRRLLSVVDKYRQAANKDIAKFADQIISLCDKWEK